MQTKKDETTTVNENEDDKSDNTTNNLQIKLPQLVQVELNLDSLRGYLDEL